MMNVREICISRKIFVMIIVSVVSKDSTSIFILLTAIYIPLSVTITTKNRNVFIFLIIKNRELVYLRIINDNVRFTIFANLFS